jgi:hypothetical protein
MPDHAIRGRVSVFALLRTRLSKSPCRHIFARKICRDLSTRSFHRISPTASADPPTLVLLRAPRQRVNEVLASRKDAQDQADELRREWARTYTAGSAPQQIPDEDIVDGAGVVLPYSLPSPPLLHSVSSPCVLSTCVHATRRGYTRITTRGTRACAHVRLSDARLIGFWVRERVCFTWQEAEEVDLVSRDMVSSLFVCSPSVLEHAQASCQRPRPSSKSSWIFTERSTHTSCLWRRKAKGRRSSFASSPRTRVSTQRWGTARA